VRDWQATDLDIIHLGDQAMERPTTSVLLASTLLLVVALSADAGAQTGAIAGQVTARASGAPLSRASIQVSSPALADTAGTTTDADGLYVINGLPVGTYAVDVTFVGYRAATSRNVDVDGDQTATVDFQLTSAPIELTETVISASRRAENIVDAPVSITKIRADKAVQTTTGLSFASLLEHVRGIDYTQRGIFTEKYNARGFNSGVGYNSRMVMLLDGMQASESSPAVSLQLHVPKEDLQDVEVIVGPGSALYGADAVAGIISVTTKDPRDSEGTTLALAGGTRSTFKGRFRHAGARDKWGWKVAGGHQQAHDYEVADTHYSADSSRAVTEDPDYGAHATRGKLGLYYYPDAESRIAFQTGAGNVDLIDQLDYGRIAHVDLRNWYKQLTYSSVESYVNLYHENQDLGDTYFVYSRAQYRADGLSEAEARERSSIPGEMFIRGAEVRRKSRLQHWRSHLTYGLDYRRSDERVAFVEGGRFVAWGLGAYTQAETDINKAMSEIPNG